MPKELEQFAGNAPFSITELLINLGIGLVLALIVRWHFLRFGSTLSNRDELGGVLPFILLTTVLIISVVKSSLALSLGLVGALSIVRFRTPIKEPEELAYLFIAIAIGLGLGANQVLATVSASLFILLVMTGVKQYSGKSKGTNLYLSVSVSGDADGGGRTNKLTELVSKHVRSTDIRRLDERADGIDVTYLIDIASTNSLSELSDALREQYPDASLTFLDQNGMPGI